MRNTIILSGLVLMVIVGAIIFYVGRSGAISADVESKDCKFYAFTDRKTYTYPQTVNFGIKNDKYSKCILQIRNDIGAWSVLNSKGEEIYKADALGAQTSKLKPNQRQDWQWRLVTSSGSTVPSGKYKIKFTSLNKEVEFSVLSN